MGRSEKSRRCTSRGTRQPLPNTNLMHPTTRRSFASTSLARATTQQPFPNAGLARPATRKRIWEMLPHFGGSPAAGALEKMVAATRLFRNLRLTPSLPGSLRTANYLPWLAAPQWAGFCPLARPISPCKRLENPDFAEASRQNRAQPQTTPRESPPNGRQTHFRVAPPFHVSSLSPVHNSVFYSRQIHPNFVFYRRQAILMSLTKSHMQARLSVCDCAA